ncbi:MAG: Na+/H+ antiporter subunit E [Candidatus Methanofastidiosia archaeon]
MKRFVSSFLCCLTLWLLLTKTADYTIVVMGIISSVCISIPCSKFFPEFGFSLRRLAYFIVYIPILFYEIIKSNLDVGYIVIHPKMPMNPGIVKIPINIKSSYGKTFLANSITLTPGTLTVNVDEKKNKFYIHWINITTHKPNEEAKIICGRFEKWLRGVFE